MRHEESEMNEYTVRLCFWLRRIAVFLKWGSAYPEGYCEALQGVLGKMYKIKEKQESEKD